MGTSTTTINGGTPIRNVDTGAKDVPDLTQALSRFENKAGNQVWMDQKKVPGEIVGQFKIFMGVDASDSVMLVRSKTGELSLWEQNFGIHLGTGEPGAFHSLCRKIASLGEAVTAPGDWDDHAKAYAYFGDPKNAGDALKHTGYNVALSGGQIFVEKPNVHGPHTLLVATPVKQAPIEPQAGDPGSGAGSIGTPGDVQSSIEALVKKTAHAGQWAQFKGTVVHELRFEGSSRPAGAYLKLAYPINVTGTGADGKSVTKKAVTELYLGGIEQFPNGRTTVNGQVGLLPLRPVLAPGQTPPVSGYLPMLGGTTDVGRGEPAYKGWDKGFVNAKGDKLPQIEWSEMVPDIPSHLVVPDFDQMKAYVGSIGGFVANGPFRGFNETTGIREPDALDERNIKMQADGSVKDLATGKTLKEVGMIPDEGHPEPSPTKFFVDKDTNTMYAFREAGFAGNIWTMTGVIDMAHRAPIIALEGGDTPAA